MGMTGQHSSGFSGM